MLQSKEKRSPGTPGLSCLVLTIIYMAVWLWDGNAHLKSSLLHWLKLYYLHGNPSCRYSTKDNVQLYINSKCFRLISFVSKYLQLSKQLLLHRLHSCAPYTKDCCNGSNSNTDLCKFQGFLTRMVYLHYISCLRYSILVGNPRFVQQYLWTSW